MGEIQLVATAGADGVLHLSIPVRFAGAEYEVVVRPKAAAPLQPTPEKLGYPPGHFEKLYGSIPDFSIEPRYGGFHLDGGEG